MIPAELEKFSKRINLIFEELFMGDFPNGFPVQLVAINMGTRVSEKDLFEQKCKENGITGNGVVYYIRLKGTFSDPSKDLIDRRLAVSSRLMGEPEIQALEYVALFFKIDMDSKKPEHELFRVFCDVVSNELSTEIRGTGDFKKIEELDLLRNINDEEWIRGRWVREAFRLWRLPQPRLMNELSASMYEGRALQTGMLFYRKDERPRFLFTFSEEQKYYLKLGDIRLARKLLELSGRECYLAVELNDDPKDSVHAVGGIVSDTENGNFISIHFPSAFHWHLKFGEQKILAYHGGTYLFGEAILEQDPEEICRKSRDKVKELIEQSETGKKADDVYKKITTVIKTVHELQEHGCAIIFADKGILDKERKRLSNKNRGYWLKDPITIDELKTCKSITSIDGAILANLTGDIYAMGVILDGDAVEAGDLSKGARHNSIATYIARTRERYSKECSRVIMIAAIFSEDGYVSLKFS